MKALHVHSGNLFGGIETFQKNLVLGQDSFSGMHHEFALCFEARLSQELRDLGAAVHVLGPTRASRPLSVWRARRALRVLISRSAPDVLIVHGSWAHSLFGGLAQDCGLPLISFIHAPPEGKHWLDRVARRVRPALLIANSRFSAESARRLFPEVPLQVIYCPVKNSARQLAPVARAALRSSLSTSPSDTVIIQVSRIEAGKGHRLQLEALHLLKDRPGWQCWIVGGAQRKEEKEYEVALREFARDLGISKRLHFLGERADVPNLLAAADVFAQPNVSGEGFGIVFIEALQAGLPIVATAIGATYEVLDESCSLIVPPEPIALAEAYVRLLADKDLRSRLGRNGPARAYAISDPAHRLAEINAALMSASRDGLPGTPLLK